MSAAHDYEELHNLVDQQEFEPTAEALDRRRRLSFAGIMEAEPDLAERSEDILRSEC